jgi:hypothetical protein
VYYYSKKCARATMKIWVENIDHKLSVRLYNSKFIHLAYNKMSFFEIMMKNKESSSTH